ncbi:MAG: MBL fold metallo-hydrolase [Balneolaceae bacterium]
MKTFFIYIFLMLISVATAEAQLTNTPDTLETEKGSLVIQPILHGTVVFEWNDKIIYVDPYGGAEAFKGVPNPDIILITHPHGDHLNLETLEAIHTENATFIVPQAVADELPQEFKSRIQVLKNDESTNLLGISVLAVPMYNLPEEDARHAKGWGNGYVLTMGGKNIYLSGDTEDIPEMRSLQNIDVAFVCMNLPYTMDINQAASAVIEFEPAIMYPYHHRGQDIEEFKTLVDEAGRQIDVRLKNWYPAN